LLTGEVIGQCGGLVADLEKLTDHKLVTACAALQGPMPQALVRCDAPAVVVPDGHEEAMR